MLQHHGEPENRTKATTANGTQIEAEPNITATACASFARCAVMISHKYKRRNVSKKEPQQIAQHAASKLHPGSGTPPGTTGSGCPGACWSW